MRTGSESRSPPEPASQQQDRPSITEGAARLLAGQRFGRYEALIEVASGGMGRVCVGRLRGPNGFKRLVAIKTVHAHLSRDEQYVKMFMREADIASRLHHPNVVPVLELGQEGEEYYLVMEYFPSVSLSSMLRMASRAEQHIPHGASISMVAEACAGLDAAHNLNDSDGQTFNLVHRDITPSNLLAGDDGTIKITDFGIAKASGAAFGALTGAQTVIRGKLAYLSPEQVRCEPLDRRSDIFCLGIVLYEVTTCSRLFKGDNELGLMRAILDGPMPDPRDLRSDCPEALALIIKKALERDPSARFQTAADFRRALLDLQREFPAGARTEFVRGLLGPLFSERARSIVNAEVLLDGGTGSKSIPSRSGPRPAAIPVDDLTATTPVSQAGTTETPAVSTTRPPRRARWRFAVPSIAAAVVIAVALAVWAPRHSAQSSAAIPPTPATTPSAPRPLTAPGVGRPPSPVAPAEQTRTTDPEATQSPPTVARDAPVRGGRPAAARQPQRRVHPGSHPTGSTQSPATAQPATSAPAPPPASSSSHLEM